MKPSYSSLLAVSLLVAVPGSARAERPAERIPVTLVVTPALSEEIEAEKAKPKPEWKPASARG